MPILYCDNNKSTLCIAANSNVHEWTKHFEIDCHLSRGMGKAFCSPHEELLPISSSNQIAYHFIKTLPPQSFFHPIAKLRLIFNLWDTITR
jgi:hypothetical protein